MSGGVKLGPIEFVPNQPEYSEILLVTMRCLQIALERHNDGMAKTLCETVNRILNPCLMFHSMPIISDDFIAAGAGGMK